MRVVILIMAAILLLFVLLAIAWFLVLINFDTPTQCDQGDEFRDENR